MSKIRDRLSFRDFLGLTFADKVPDAKTIWLFAEQLKNIGLETKLFKRFEEELERQGFEAKEGKTIDGTFVEVPKHAKPLLQHEPVAHTEKTEKCKMNGDTAQRHHQVV